MTPKADRIPLAMLLVLGLTCFVGWEFKAYCLNDGWTGLEQFTIGCYTDAVPFWSDRGLAAGEIPYLEARMEYPVLTGILVWLNSAITHALFGARAGPVPFVLIVTLVNSLLAAVALALLHRAGLRGARLWAWALSPLLILYIGHNWDMLAIVLALGAVLLARERRLVAAATAAGLGVAAKLFPILLLPFLGLQTLFAPGARWRLRLGRATLLSAAAIGAWAAVNLPFALAAWENWSEFYRFSGARGGTLASTWEVLARQGWLTDDHVARNLISALSFLGGAAAILAIGWRPHRERLYILFTPLLAWFLLTSKVYSPQFDLWLYPLLLLTAPRMLPVGLFVAAGIAVYFAEFRTLAGLAGAFPDVGDAPVAITATARAVVMLWLIADALRLPAPAWLDASSADQGSGSELARS